MSSLLFCIFFYTIDTFFSYFEYYTQGRSVKLENMNVTIESNIFTNGRFLVIVIYEGCLYK